MYICTAQNVSQSESIQLSRKHVIHQKEYLREMPISGAAILLALEKCVLGKAKRRDEYSILEE